ncbi:response regulator [bacterium]|nr:response regulator [bacterium]
MSSHNELIILLVEDDVADVKLTKRVLSKSKLHLSLNVVRDGVEAMAYLRREGEFSQAVRPDLVLLDLNLPKKDGREVLKEIREDKALKSLPVVVLTTSQAEEDIARSYDLHANCFITKPVDLQQFTKVVQAVEDFWLTVVRLPSKEDER